MKIELQRIERKCDRVFGLMSINGASFCDTLEPANCIPAGTYKMRITWSPHFKCWLPELLNVPGRTAIRIHAGNLPQHTRGCILVGQHQQNYLMNSKAALTDLMQQFGKHEKEIHTISII